MATASEELRPGTEDFGRTKVPMHKCPRLGVSCHSSSFAHRGPL